MTASNVRAAEPHIRRITPAGLSSGQSRSISLIGERLSDVTGILFYDQRLKASEFKVTDDKNITFEVAADPSLNNDLYAFRLISKTGLSNMRLLGVNKFPSVVEVEPNSDFESPQVIELQQTIDGTVRNEDVDYFAVELEAGQTLSVELEGLRHASDQNFFDPSLAILDANRFEVASNDDATLLRQDCLCSFQALQAGRYIIEVRESSYGGNDDCLYRLHVSNQTRPVTMIPAGGKPGELLQATLIDDLGNSWQEEFQLPDSPTESFSVWSNRNGVQSPSPNYLRVVELENYVEAEPNGDMKSVAPVSVIPAAFQGVLQEENDEDFFAFSAKKDQRFEIQSVTRSAVRSPADTVLNIFKLNGNHLAGNDDNKGPDSFLDFKAPEDGDYAIRVRDHLGRGGIDFVYRVELNAKSPSVQTDIAEQSRYQSQQIVVPQGARTAIEVKVNRRNIGGDAMVNLEGLPAGLSAEAVLCPADRSSVPIVIRSSSDTALSATLASIRTVITQGDTSITGPLRQRTQLIRAQNNVDVWGFDCNQVAVAATEAAPFDIEVIQPGVPLVRDGTMNLKVKLHRKEGFDGQVRLRLVYNTPGMSANGSIRIEKDVTETEIPITANGNATLGVWAMSLLAWTSIDRGDIKLSSEPFTIEIADRIFDFAFNKAMGEVGKPIDVLVGVKQKRVLEGTTEIELVGLPPGTTCDASKVVFDPTAEQVVYRLNVPADAKPGSFKTLNCRGTITSDAGVITQTNGTGEVQIDVPLVAAPAAPAPTASPEPAAPKVLTRLEQLRAMRESN